METKININNYITEEEKKEIAIDAFKERIKTQLFNSREDTVQADSEIQRIIGNITHDIVFNEVQKYIPDFKSLLIKNVRKALSKDMSYEVFRKKDAWDTEESLAIKYMKEEVKANEDVFKQRIKDEMGNYDLTDTINEKISDEFDKLASSMYDLSELFKGK